MSHDKRSRTKQGIQAIGRHQESIEALGLAATYWDDVARALEEHSEQRLQGEEVTQQDLRTLIRHARAQRLRVWTIAQRLLKELIGCFPPYYGRVDEPAGMRCQHEGGAGR